MLNAVIQIVSFVCTVALISIIRGLELPALASILLVAVVVLAEITVLAGIFSGKRTSQKLARETA
ncbi:MAG: hypothetical protein BWY57_03147 [Betaproteobacteria bacterium ADurb.Bin341]|nr:MAG: hypothetical protein BWY57_03147 [Betaproteobacteria bacterium ADurb.Bin341]